MSDRVQKLSGLMALFAQRAWADHKTTQGIEPGRRYTEYCQRKGCGVATSWRKPYCEDHILDLDYARSVHDDNQAALAEVRSVLEGYEPDPFGLVAREILLHLQVNGAATYRALVKSLPHLSSAGDRHARDRVVAAYTRVMERAGLVKTRGGRKRKSDVFVEPLAA